MTSPSSELIIATLNIQGQSNLNIVKQIQIEDFLKYNNIDILHLQEIEISSKTFDTCRFISSNFNVIQNNSPVNKYGTATLVRNDLQVQNIKCDTEGRVIVFDIENVSFVNMYLHSGNNKEMRQSRDNYFCQVIPQMRVRREDLRS